MDEKCFFAYIFREKRGISKNRTATNSVEGCAPKKEQSRTSIANLHWNIDDTAMDCSDRRLNWIRRARIVGSNCYSKSFAVRRIASIARIVSNREYRDL